MDKETIAVTNLFDGVDYYSLSSQNLVDSIRVKITDNCPTSILFDERGLVAFGGSSGVVQVACLSPPAIIQTLEVEGNVVYNLHLDEFNPPFFVGNAIIQALVCRALSAGLSACSCCPRRHTPQNPREGIS